MSMMRNPTSHWDRDDWTHAWEAIKGLPNLRAVEFTSRNALTFRTSNREISSHDIVDSEWVATANNRIQFYFIVYDYPHEMLWVNYLSANNTLLKTTVRHLAPFNADVVNEALAELKSACSQPLY
jgi:hypothetical protein